jgi:cyclomaltodextrinase / maltogenic alpha-amylase / neopullulanase
MSPIYKPLRTLRLKNSGNENDKPFHFKAIFMKKVITILPLFFCTIILAQKYKTAFNEPPSWSKSAIWYQIFVERFYNGDPSNDPRPENINIPPGGQLVPEGWSVTPWTADWYKQETWAEQTGKDFNYNAQMRRFGGDLQGVLDKLGYLQELGITALFLNPINDAPSLHKYDARNYHHVDVNFGPDPVGDNKIIASENPVDPTTWKWTSADKLFLKLIEELHKRGMKIIMDYSWNHTGVLFWAWEDILKNQSASKYKDWYEIKSFDDPQTAENEFTYSGWAGVGNLPEIKKVNVTTPRVNGFPYEGDIYPAMKQHIFDVTKRWLAPNGDISKGIDGFRLDVADQIGLVFWRDYRKFVRSVQPDAYLVGEIWWQKWPDNMMDPAPYTKGDIFDAVMFYQVYQPARYFFAKTNFPIDAKQLKDSLEFQWKRLNKANLFAMMNTSSSHDAPRLLTCFNNPNKYKFKSISRDDPQYKTGKPDPETYVRLRLYLVHLFTTIGAPQVWNGEEMGMWGADDPDCRKPLWWKEYRFKPETRNNYQPGEKQYDPVGFNQQQYDFYKKLISLRKNNPVLTSGELVFLVAEGKKLAYKRVDKQDEIIVLFNLEPTNQSFALGEKGDYIDLLNSRKIKGGEITLNSLSAVILKRVK